MAPGWRAQRNPLAAPRPVAALRGHPLPRALRMLTPYDLQKPRRIAHLAEGLLNPRRAKTTTGVLRYGHHANVCVIDSTNAGKTADAVVGCGAGVPIVASLEEAVACGADTLLVGVANSGGTLPDGYRPIIAAALRDGLDVLSGLHDFLADDPALVEAARLSGAAIWDVRRAPANLPVGSGKARFLKQRIVYTAGTDAALGKMTTSLELERAARAAGIRATFVATGQTGIMIAGWGSPVDALAGDFMAGAVERDVLSVADRSDVILVEGQGSLWHPGFSAVTLGILHGACPDAYILCHEVGREEIANSNGVRIPPLDVVARGYEAAMGWIRPAKLIGVALNSSKVDEATARRAIDEAEALLGVPATDPVRFGCGKLVRVLAA